ncbi:hypothetical protein [Texcoconibacillus texcoconensis]|uniref:Uncharacterized protein n=1 Tax=Texcoconibacillus texcoconensis TaxID=1095777 RepID=A0A840QTY3_9BACI|nr:hypothetical protein [Texcoconibacillus texcoconensis]MBB5174810.1 hypothetical protein [Texcoconibacillus texcoconensis]
MIRCDWKSLGEDDLIMIDNEINPHMGAVVIATWEEGTVHLVSHGIKGYRQELLLMELAKVWCAGFEKNTVISGGLPLTIESENEYCELVDQLWVCFFDLMMERKKAN